MLRHDEPVFASVGFPAAGAGFGQRAVQEQLACFAALELPDEVLGRVPGLRQSTALTLMECSRWTHALTSSVRLSASLVRVSSATTAPHHSAQVS